MCSDPPNQGLSLARQIAMISYRSAESYHEKFGRNIDEKTNQWQVHNYLQYQGKKFLDRFDALTYVCLTEVMDSHDVGRHRDGGVPGALRSIRCPVLVLGMESDVIYPISEQRYLADHIPHARFGAILTKSGHDGFLLEQDQIGDYINDFLATSLSLH